MLLLDGQSAGCLERRNEGVLVMGTAGCRHDPHEESEVAGPCAQNAMYMWILWATVLNCMLTRYMFPCKRIVV